METPPTSKTAHWHAKLVTLTAVQTVLSATTSSTEDVMGFLTVLVERTNKLVVGSRFNSQLFRQSNSEIIFLFVLQP